MAKVLIIDTSIMCVWLRLPGFTSCGKDKNKWDFARIDSKLREEIAADSSLVLPLATIIETGNHIAQCSGDRYAIAGRFCEILASCVDNEIPWAAFSEQTELWSDEAIKQLAASWPEAAGRKESLGDATIASVANYYAKARFDVEIFTGDEGLKSYEPGLIETLTPRRRKK